jgi:phage head maturation protease
MDLVKKAVGLVDTVETDSPNGAFEVVLSAATLDRDGEIIDSRAFDPLPDHVPFDIDHGMTVQTTVGSGQPYYAEDGSLRVKGTFASTPLAQEVRTLVAEGHIRTTSVTFMAAERVKDEKSVDHVTRAELLNGTFTPVPSNREAVVLSAKALNVAVDEKVGARNSASDASKIQAAHDSMVDLGAACPGAAKSATENIQAGIDYAKRTYAKDIAPEVEATPESLAQAVDATLDEAMGLLAGFDTSTLPAEVAQAIALLVAADNTVDELLTVMGLVDPDEEPDTADGAAGAAADAAAPAAKSAVTPPDVLARLAVTENAARLAFGL